MLQPSRLGYLAFDVADLDASVRFYQDLVHLEVINERDGTVFLRGSTEHHWMVLRQSRTPGFNRVAYEMASEQALDQMAQNLKSAGVEVTHGGDIEADGVERWIRFRDPEGIQFELFVNMLTLPVPPIARSYIRLEKLVHAGVSIKDVRRSHAFYHDILGFRDSDWAERRAVLMHCGDRYHHSLAVLGNPAAPRSTIDHMCIQVAGVDDLMRARNLVLANHIPFSRDLARHMASGSWGFYFLDQANHYDVEFCLEHRQLPEVGDQARMLPAIPEMGDVWQIVRPLSRTHSKGIPQLGMGTKDLNGESSARTASARSQPASK
jgi:2,3-dihydroxy-p-cumate/2,3-dihydroxybenzoate 3,4-dioxygenase